MMRPTYLPPVKVIGIAFVLLFACTNVHPTCANRFDGSALAAQNRVREIAHLPASLTIGECQSVPTGSGWSSDPDEYACTVTLDGSREALYLSNLDVHALAEALPSIVANLSRRTGIQPTLVDGSLSFSEVKRWTVFFDSEKAHAFVYVRETRCFIREEVT